MDRYRDFEELAREEKEGEDFVVRVREVDGCSTVVVAPHGGAIEPGTSEIADAIAAEDMRFYAFEGIKVTGNRRLHITSTRFDEPRSMALIRTSACVLAIHGEASEEPVAFVGGRDKAGRDRLSAMLSKRGFTARAHSNPALWGEDANNVCNRGTAGAGVQLEISVGLRRTLFRSLTAVGRRTRTDRFDDLVTSVRESIDEL